MTASVGMPPGEKVSVVSTRPARAETTQASARGRAGPSARPMSSERRPPVADRAGGGTGRATIFGAQRAEAGGRPIPVSGETSTT